MKTQTSDRVHTHPKSLFYYLQSMNDNWFEWFGNGILYSMEENKDWGQEEARVEKQTEEAEV